MKQSRVNDRAAFFNIVGELTDQRAEKEFQEAQFPATRKRMRFVCLMTAPAYLAAFFADSLQIAGSDLWLMGFARSFVATLGVLCFFVTFKKKLSPIQLGFASGIYMLALICTESIELILKADQVSLPETPITIFIVLLFYLYLPPQIWQSIIASGVGTLAYITTLVCFTSASAGHISNTTLIFLLANGFGLYFSIRFGAAQRREYLALSELKHQAATDSLTGVLNRRQLIKLGSREFNAAKRYNHFCSLLQLDIDHFKSINDTYGHAAGDAVLVDLAARCSEILREVDLFGRVGGEEFVIIMPHSTGAQARSAAERLRKVVCSTPFDVADTTINVTVSIGVAELSDKITTLGALLLQADKALYLAKQNGRNNVRESE